MVDSGFTIMNADSDRDSDPGPTVRVRHWWAVLGHGMMTRTVAVTVAAASRRSYRDFRAAAAPASHSVPAPVRRPEI